MTRRFREIECQEACEVASGWATVSANNGLLVKTTALKSPVSKFTSMLTCLLLMEYFDGGFGRF